MDWFVDHDCEESEPRSTFTPAGAPMYFRLRTLSHSPDTVNLANRMNFYPGLPSR